MMLSSVWLKLIAVYPKLALCCPWMDEVSFAIYEMTCGEPRDDFWKAIGRLCGEPLEDIVESR